MENFGDEFEIKGASLINMKRAGKELHAWKKYNFSIFRRILPILSNQSSILISPY